jgi:hypothetical protein
MGWGVEQSPPHGGTTVIRTVQMENVYQSGAMPSGHVPVRVGHFHQYGYKVGYFCGCSAGKCYRIIRTTSDGNGINIFWHNERGAEETANVNPEVYVYAYL